MGLSGGIVRKVFSKSPCSSAGAASRAHSEKGTTTTTADHRRRWSSLRLYLCGEEMNANAEDDDDGDGDGDGETVSVKSFETTCCVMPPEDQAHVIGRLMTTSYPHDDGAVELDNDDTPGEPAAAEDQGGSRVPAGDGEQGHGHVVVVVPATDEREGAATMIQSAFRSFLARRQLQELRTRHEQEQMGGGGGGGQDQEPSRSPTATGASVATSVLVQVSESLSNLRLMSEDSASVQQQQQRSCSQQQRSSRPPAPAPPPAFRVKEEWDDSTVSSNVSRMRIQSRIEATTRRERALAYAFSQQLRSCSGGSKKRSARAEQGEFNVGWSWLERWMATRQAEPAAAADDCMSRNADAGSAAGMHRRVVVVRRRNINDLAGEEKESCGSNDVSVVSFDGSSSLGGGARSGLSSCQKPPSSSKSRLKGGRNLPRRKQVAASDHRLQARSHKVSKKGHQRLEQEPHRDRLDAGGFHDAYQPPTDY